MNNTLKDKLVPTKHPNANFENSPLCAYYRPEEKQKWRENGGYYTADELAKLEKDCDVILTTPLSRVLSAD